MGLLKARARPPARGRKPSGLNLPVLGDFRQQRAAQIRGALQRRLGFERKAEQEAAAMPEIGSRRDLSEKGIAGPGFAKQVEMQENFTQEMREVQELMNSGGLMEMDRERLQPSQKEIFDLRMLFTEALGSGQVKNMKEFELFLAKWLVETHKNPKAAAYAPTAIKKLLGSFSKKEVERLREKVQNIRTIAEGGNPNE